MQPPEAVVVNGGKGEGRSQCIYYILELFLRMTMLLEAVSVYTKACNINFFSNSKSILVRNTHYCIVALYGQLEGLNTKVGRDSHPYLIVSCLDVTSYLWLVVVLVIH